MGDKNSKKRPRSHSREYEDARAGPSRSQAGSGYSHHHSEGDRDWRSQSDEPARGRPRHEPSWAYRHPFGVYHTHGCNTCYDQEEHAIESARTDPQLALLIAERIADDPLRLRRRLEDAEQESREAHRTISSLRREVDELRQRLARTRNAGVAPVPPPALPV